MLSRVGDALYWMSRYAERAENVARFIQVNENLSLDMPDPSSQQWEPLVVTTGDQEAFRERYDEATKRKVLEFLVFDRQNPNSIVSCLTSARENARAVRQVISLDMWEQINHTYLWLRDRGDLDAVLDDPDGFFREILQASYTFVGVTDATMTHGEGWHFCRLGRMIERADKTSRILDVKYYILLPRVADVGSSYDELHWHALLSSASALEMYRQRHKRVTPDRVVDFLVLDKEFPRAVLHCLTRANDSLHAITGTPMDSFGNLAEQRLGRVRAELAYSRADRIIAEGLHEFIDHLQVQLNFVGHGIFDAFFRVRDPGTGPSQRSVAEG